ncbi:MAG: hypothetical protein GY835_21255 [bacterium]|nr:hypothetical protein [bacterium]
MQVTRKQILTLSLLLLLPFSVLAEEGTELQLKTVFYQPYIKHDPFAIPDFSKSTEPSDTGKLSLGNCKLVGIMMTDEGAIAMVEDAAGESYSLRKGDSILGGKISRIEDSTLEAWVRQDGLRKRIRLSLVEEGE